MCTYCGDEISEQRTHKETRRSVLKYEMYVLFPGAAFCFRGQRYTACGAGGEGRVAEEVLNSGKIFT